MMSKQINRVYICVCKGCRQFGAPPNPKRAGLLGSSVTVKTIPCSRTFDPRQILKLLISGASKVMIVGCSENGEMTLASDYEVGKRMKVMRSLLSQMSLGQDRVIAKWLPVKAWRQRIFEADYADPSFIEITS